MDRLQPNVLQNIAKFLSLRGGFFQGIDRSGELFSSFEPLCRNTKEIVNEVGAAYQPFMIRSCVAR